MSVTAFERGLWSTAAVAVILGALVAVLRVAVWVGGMIEHVFGG